MVKNTCTLHSCGQKEVAQFIPENYTEEKHVILSCVLLFLERGHFPFDTAEQPVGLAP